MHFVEIIDGVRVVQAVEFVSDDPAFAGRMTMRWELRAVDGGTRVDIVADDVPDGISPEDHEAGLTSSLASLDEFVMLSRRSPLSTRDATGSCPSRLSE